MSSRVTVLLCVLVAAGTSAAFWAFTAPPAPTLVADLQEHGRWVELDARLAALEGLEPGPELIGRPDAGVTRTEFAKLLARIEALEKRAATSVEGTQTSSAETKARAQADAVEQALLAELANAGSKQARMLHWRLHQVRLAKRLPTVKKELETASGDKRVELLNQYAQGLDVVRNYKESKQAWADLVREAGLNTGVGREAQYNLGWAHRNAGDPATGRQHMLEASRHFPVTEARHWDARKKAVDFAFQVGDRDTARREADEIIRDLEGNTKGDSSREATLERVRALREKIGD